MRKKFLRNPAPRKGFTPCRAIFLARTARRNVFSAAYMYAAENGSEILHASGRAPGAYRALVLLTRAVRSTYSSVSEARDSSVSSSKSR